MKIVRHAGRGNREQGYILLTLLLFVALLAIGMTAAVARVDMQIRRDREEEMIHRGVQYSRAIRLYVKKFGRYPTQIKDLEDTNNMRFLRRAYKDPITGKNFKLLHLGDVKTVFNSGIAGATPLGGGNPAAAAGAGQPGMPQGTPATPQGASSSNNNDQSSTADSSDSGSDNSSDESGSQSGFSGQVFGGGPIMGVASTSKEKSIRVFNHEDHYNQWQFIYDPTQDRGGLITTPYQPMMQGVGMAGGVGQPINPGTSSQGQGNGSFGMQNPMQQPQMPPEANAPSQ